MVLVLRPLAVALASWRTALTLQERAFVAWMAPRGIVAGATASAFGLELAQSGVDGADKILPITFLVIFATVCLYGLSAEPVARALGLAGSRATTVLVVGGHRWARKVAESLDQAGLNVTLWTGRREEQQAAEAAGLRADHGRMLVDAMSREAELEEITQALLLTASDDFNALAAAELREELGHASVHRVAPTPGADRPAGAGQRGVDPRRRRADVRCVHRAVRLRRPPGPGSARRRRRPGGGPALQRHHQGRAPRGHAGPPDHPGGR